METLNRVTSSAVGGPPVAIITGMAGIGKTALALHWAHATRHRFPDGQPYVDLRGYTASPVAPIEVLTQLLRGLGVSPDRVPSISREIGARRPEAQALIGLALAKTSLGQPEAAVAHAQAALELAEPAALRVEQAHALTAAAVAHLVMGARPAAKHHAERALELYQATGYVPGAVNARNILRRALG